MPDELVATDVIYFSFVPLAASDPPYCRMTEGLRPNSPEPVAVAIFSVPRKPALIWLRRRAPSGAISNADPVGALPRDRDLPCGPISNPATMAFARPARQPRGAPAIQRRRPGPGTSVGPASEPFRRLGVFGRCIVPLDAGRALIDPLPKTPALVGSVAPTAEPFLRPKHRNGFSSRSSMREFQSRIGPTVQSGRHAVF
jgi:hypothetical protein